MRGKKTTPEDKLLRGTANSTREKQKSEKIKNTDPEVVEYLSKIKTMLDFLWTKINTEEIKNDVDILEKYSKQFIMWQKHYFSYKDLVPQKIESTDIISELISNKEL